MAIGRSRRFPALINFFVLNGLIQKSIKNSLPVDFFCKSDISIYIPFQAGLLLKHFHGAFGADYPLHVVGNTLLQRIHLVLRLEVATHFKTEKAPYPVG